MVMSTKVPRKIPRTAFPMVPQLIGRANVKHVAVTATNPKKFAEELDYETNELINQGYAITGHIERGGALIIVGSRILPVAIPGNLPPEQPMDTTSEVVYRFTDGSREMQVRCFPSLGEAIKLIKEHLLDPKTVPQLLLVNTVAAFDPKKDLPILEKIAKV